MAVNSLFLVALAWAVVFVQGASKLPNFVFILADDYGWANVGYHRNGSDPEVVTPNIDALAKGGVILDRHYTFNFCSPSRCSLQSGRLPVHVNVLNSPPETRNANDPVSGFAGIPVNMTTIASKLQTVGYRGYMTGKWDAGMATPRHTPEGRGYEKFLGYFHHSNDYYTEGLPFSAIGQVNICANKYTDLWHDNHSAADIPRNSSTYEEDLFADHTIDAINTHDPAQPMFLFHSFHSLHTPLEVPQTQLDKFKFIHNPERKKIAAMANYMDQIVGKIVDALKAKDLYDNTLLVFSADNGGAIYWPAGGNNYPLKGGKMADWEGGVRVNAFVAGGYLPSIMQGKTVSTYMHIADWYATFCDIAGLDPTDHEAAAANLPPIDSISQWAVLNGSTTVGSRSEIHLSSQALITGPYKIITGNQTMTGYTGPYYPNNTGIQPLFPPAGFADWMSHCGTGELYNIIEDPYETNNLAATNPQELKIMQARLQLLNAGNFAPDRGQPDQEACVVARTLHGGYYGPFVDV